VLDKLNFHVNFNINMEVNVIKEVHKHIAAVLEAKGYKEGFPLSKNDKNRFQINFNGTPSEETGSNNTYKIQPEYTIIFKFPLSKNSRNDIQFEIEDLVEELILTFGNFNNWYNGNRTLITAADPEEEDDYYKIHLSIKTIGKISA